MQPSEPSPRLLRRSAQADRSSWPALLWYRLSRLAISRVVIFLAAVLAPGRSGAFRTCPDTGAMDLGTGAGIGTRSAL